MTESEKADTKAFLQEILSILPLVELRVFEKAKKIETGVSTGQVAVSRNALDTVVVPAHSEGFNHVFLGENCWHAIRISGGELKDIKYIAAYQTAPVSAVTHYAEVASIEPYGDRGKYKLSFAASAKPIGPIQYGDAKQGMMQGSRYTSHEKLFSAKYLMDLLD